jgi:hypothetical protein
VRRRLIWTAWRAPGKRRLFTWSRAGGAGDDASAGTVFRLDHGAQRTP